MSDDERRGAQDAVRKAHEWLERVDQLKQPGSYFGLDHKLGENDDGCTFCHAAAVLEGRLPAIGATDD
jgi:hypothetical protein